VYETKPPIPVLSSIS